MKNNPVCCASIFLLLFFAPANAGELIGNASSQETSVSGFQENLDWAVASIKDRESLHQHMLLASRGVIASPLMLIPEPDRTDFLDSIVFSNDGIGGYKYSPLTKWLTPVEAYKVLSLFGQQTDVGKFSGFVAASRLDRQLLNARETGNPSANSSNLSCIFPGHPACNGADDHEDYECTGPGGCIANDGHICNPQYCE